MAFRPGGCQELLFKALMSGGNSGSGRASEADVLVAAFGLTAGIRLPQLA
jgi:hypothetical protein